MSMNLSAEQLREIASSVEKIAAAELHVTEFKAAGHNIVLERKDDQRDGVSYRVKGISDRPLSGKTGTCRC